MKTSIVYAILCGLLLSACGGGSGESLNKLITPKPKPSSSTSSLSPSSVPLSSALSSASESISSSIASSDGSSSAANSSLASVQTGVFLDAAVSNLGYRTQSLEGFTNSLGEFHFRAGETIVFFMGALEFPAVPVADIITPLDLANSDNPNHPMVINIARLLQSFDSDGDTANGISLSEAAISAAPLLDLTLAPEVFEQLPALATWLQAAGAGQALISVEQALAHLQTTLDFIYGVSSSSSSAISSSAASVSSSVVEPSSASSQSSQAQSSSTGVIEQSSSSLALSSVQSSTEFSTESSAAFSVEPSSEASSVASSELSSSVQSSVVSSDASSSAVESSLASSEQSSAESSAVASEPSSSSVESSLASSEIASEASSAMSSEASSSAAESSIASSEQSSSAVSSSSEEPSSSVASSLASSEASSTESSSNQSSSNASSVNSAIILDEAFAVDKATLFSAAYQAISTDANAARYVITGGGSGITIVNNQLSIVGGRLTIGHRPPRTATTAADLTANGDFDLSRAYRIQFTVASAAGDGKIQVYVDNSTTSQGNSLHGADSKVYEVAASSLAVGQVISIVPEVGTATSFIAIRAESSATLVIDNLRVEYIETEASSSSLASSEAVSSSSMVSSAPASSSSVNSSSVASSVPSSSEISFSSSSDEASSAESSASSSEESSSSESSVASSEAPSSAESSVSSSEESSSAESSVASSEVSSSEEASTSSEVSSASSSESSSEESSSSSSAGIVNTLLPIYEDFDNVVDAAGFFSVGYKALETEEAPFYHSLSGTPAFNNGRMTFGNARFTLGNTTPTIATTSGDTLTTGELDLSEAYRISFCVIAVQGSGNFQVYVNNNTTGQGNSIHGNSSRVYSQAVGSIAVGNRVVINASVGDKTSFIALRTESSAQVVIDDLWIGYQADTSTEPAAETCIPPAPATPAAPQVTAGDTQLSATWSAVPGATGYALVYNTADTTEGATAYANNPVTATSATLTGLSNDTTYYVFVRAMNAGGESDFSPSASGTPVVAGEEEPEDPTNSLVLIEDFNGATSATFFTAAYKSLPNNSASPLYIAMSNAGNAQFANDQLQITGNTIITMGAANNTATTAGAQPVGVFDLSKPYKIVFDVAANGSGSGKIQIQVDNNTSGSGGSIHGASSRVYDIAASAIVAGTVEINNPTKTGGVPVGTTSSHVSIRSEGGAKSVIIDNFRIEYIE